MGATLAILPTKTCEVRLFGISSEQWTKKKTSWKPPGSILDASGLDFGGSGQVQNEFFDGPKLIFGIFNAIRPITP